IGSHAMATTPCTLESRPARWNNRLRPEVRCALDDVPRPCTRGHATGPPVARAPARSAAPRSPVARPCPVPPPTGTAKLLALLGERSTSGGAAVRVLASWEVTTEAVALCATAS